jgi:hypothetical protein
MAITHAHAWSSFHEDSVSSTTPPTSYWTNSWTSSKFQTKTSTWGSSTHVDCCYWGSSRQPSWKTPGLGETRWRVLMILTPCSWCPRHHSLASRGSACRRLCKQGRRMIGFESLRRWVEGFGTRCSGLWSNPRSSALVKVLRAALRFGAGWKASGAFSCGWLVAWSLYWFFAGFLAIVGGSSEDWRGSLVKPTYCSTGGSYFDPNLHKSLRLSGSENPTDQ